MKARRRWVLPVRVPLPLTTTKSAATARPALGREPLYGSSSNADGVNYSGKGTLRLEEEAVIACKRALGDGERSIVSALANWARTLTRKGRMAKAEPIPKQCFMIAARTLGNDHPHTLIYVGGSLRLAATPKRSLRSKDALRPMSACLQKTIRTP